MILRLYCGCEYSCGGAQKSPRGQRCAPFHRMHQPKLHQNAGGGSIRSAARLQILLSLPNCKFARMILAFPCRGCVVSSVVQHSIVGGGHETSNYAHHWRYHIELVCWFVTCGGGRSSKSSLTAAHCQLSWRWHWVEVPFSSFRSDTLLLPLVLEGFLCKISQQPLVVA